jgi:hypothetical protein
MVVYETMFKSIVKPDMPQMAKRRIRFACWVTKDTTLAPYMYYLLLFHSNCGYANALQCQMYPYIARLVDIPANIINVWVTANMNYI